MAILCSIVLHFATVDRYMHPLYKRFPPSPACSCSICAYYCRRPGWPLVEEARLAIELGMAGRLMLEFAPDFSFGILAPAFKGNEGHCAFTLYSHNGCTFLCDSGCEIFDAAYRPIECRFCHHNRPDQGLSCHLAVARDWDTSKGRRLVHRWLSMQNLDYSKLYQIERRYVHIMP